MGFFQCNFQGFISNVYNGLFLHYLSYLWVSIIVNVLFNAIFINGYRNGVFGCVFTRSGVRMNFSHFTPISTKYATYLYLRLHSPVEVSQLFNIH